MVFRCHCDSIVCVCYTRLHEAMTSSIPCVIYLSRSDCWRVCELGGGARCYGNPPPGGAPGVYKTTKTWPRVVSLDIWYF